MKNRFVNHLNLDFFFDWEDWSLNIFCSKDLAQILNLIKQIEASTASFSSPNVLFRQDVLPLHATIHNSK